jgi:1-acyl-sn-glycerol-3-phosphate acyltransferase
MKILGRIIYWIVRALAYVVAHIIFPTKVSGKQHLKIDEPFIFCSNHMSMMDPVILVGAVLRRKAYFMGKAELYKNKFLNWFFRSLLSFPVVRGSADMAAIRTSIKHLKEGTDMMIFPEGTRNSAKDGKIMELYTGVAMIALQAKCKIVPCYIDCKGGYKFWKKFNVRIGAPIDVVENYSKDGFNKENLTKITADLRKNMEMLM